MIKMGKTIFFFFNTIIKELKPEISYENTLGGHNECFSGYIHYISAAAYAVSQLGPIDIILGASDEKTRENKELLECDFKNHICNAEIRWSDYSNNDSADEILKKIIGSCHFDIGDTVFIVANSGIRNNVMFFTTFTEILKSMGVTMRLIYAENANPQRIIDVSANNKYFEVLRGVELFTETGNPQKLKRCYSDSESLQKLFGHMEQFYKNIQVCKPVQGDGESVVKIYTDMMQEIDAIMAREDTDIIIKLLLPDIKRSFQPDKNIDEPFLQILRWCSDKGNILSGYFILDAEFTQFLMDKKILSFKGSWKNGLPTKDKLTYAYKFEKDFNRYKDGKNQITDVRTILHAFTKDTRCDNNSFDYHDKKSLEDKFFNWYIRTPNTSEKIVLLYKILMLHELARKIRNNMAHTELKNVIEKDEYSGLLIVADEINRKIISQFGSEASIFSKPKLICLWNKTKKKSEKKNEYLAEKAKRDISFAEGNAYEKYAHIFDGILSLISEWFQA